MTQYLLFLRGINVGGQHKVAMADLKASLSELGYQSPVSYINSGNLLFHSEKEASQIHQELTQLFNSQYDFPILFSLICAEDYQKEAAALPAWWYEDLARKDVLFLTEEVDKEEVRARLAAMPLQDEVIHIGELAVFWGKYNESSFLKTAYHKLLLKEPFYKLVTIRNGNTFQKMLEWSKKEQ